MNDLDRQRWIRRRRAIREAVVGRLVGMLSWLLILGFALSFVFAVLKVAGVVDWPWWAVLLPAGVDLVLWIGTLRTIWVLEEMYDEDKDKDPAS